MTSSFHFYDLSKLTQNHKKASVDVYLNIQKLECAHNINLFFKKIESYHKQIIIQIKLIYSIIEELFTVTAVIF